MKGSIQTQVHVIVQFQEKWMIMNDFHFTRNLSFLILEYISCQMRKLLSFNKILFYRGKKEVKKTTTGI